MVAKKVNVMKRTYQKPELFYENFMLNAPIALCDYQLGNSGSVEACGATSNEYGLPGDVFFTDSEVCNMTPEYYGGGGPGGGFGSIGTNS